MRPGVLPPVPYRDVREWCLAVPLRCEAPGTMKPVRPAPQESKPRGALNFCQHQGGRELGFAVWSTQVNHCSAVIANKLKVLSGLDQNGKWPGWRV